MQCGDFMENNTHASQILETVFDKSDQIKIITANLTSFNALYALVLLMPKASRISFMLMHQQLITSASELISMISQIPSVDVLTFANIKRHLITSEQTLATVCCLLTEEDSADFMRANINNFETLRYVVIKQSSTDKFALILSHIDFVTSACELFQLLLALPVGKRLELARLKRDCIKNADGLYNVLTALNPADRRAFTTEQNLSFLNIQEMLYVISCLPEDERIDFACSRIVDILSLCCALHILPREGKLDLLSRYEYMINAANLHEILEILPDEWRLNYARAQRKQITSMNFLNKVVNTLKLEDRFEFVMECKEQLNSCCAVDELLKSLPEGKRLMMANALLGKINNEYSLVYMAATLPAAEQLPFILTNMKNRHDFLFAIKLMDIDERVAFAERYIHLICFDWELSIIVGLLPAADRMAFVMKHPSLIKNNNSFGDIIDHLTADEALIFATTHQEKITTGSFLDTVCDKIPPSARKDFMKANVRNADILLILLRNSLLSERMVLATQHQHLIEDYSYLRGILYCLPSAERLSFAIANQDKPHGRHLTEVTLELPAHNQLQFITSNCKDGIDLIAALGMLSVEQRLAFAVKHQEKLLTLECLKSAGDLLGGDKHEFMKANTERIEKLLNSEMPVIQKHVKPRPFTLFDKSVTDSIHDKILNLVISRRK